MTEMEPDREPFLQEKQKGEHSESFINCLFMTVEVSICFLANSSVHNSGIELLRIISMLGIISHHLAYHTNFPRGFRNQINPKAYWLCFLFDLGKPGSAIFFLITGYFLCGRKSTDLRRLIPLLRATFFYSITGFFFGVYEKYYTIKRSWPIDIHISRSFLQIMSNNYWFVSSYVGISCLLPYLKVWYDSMKPKMLLHTAVIMYALYELPRLSTFIISNYFSTMISFSVPTYYVLLGSPLGETRRCYR